MTLKRQEPEGASVGGQRTSRLLGALEAALFAISQRYPELPAAVVVVGAGSDRRQGLFKWGHFAAMRWRPRERGDVALPEVLVAGEGLERSAEEVMTTLLHEAAHAIANSRGVQDTSRDGRYHNRRYRQVATEVGLEVGDMPPYGHALTTMRPETADLYAEQIGDVADALVLYRVADQAPTRVGGGRGRETGDDGAADGQAEGEDGRRDHNLRPATCGCGRRIRIASSTLAAGPITCGLCGAEFASAARVVDHGGRRSEHGPSPDMEAEAER